MKSYLSKKDCANLRHAAMFDDPILASHILSKNRHALHFFKKWFNYKKNVEEDVFEEILSLSILAGSIKTLAVLLQDQRCVQIEACQKALETVVRVMDKPFYCGVYDVHKMLGLIYAHPTLRHLKKPEGFISCVIRYGGVEWISELIRQPLSLYERDYLPIRCAIEQSNRTIVDAILRYSSDFEVERVSVYSEFKSMLADSVKSCLKNKDFGMAKFLIEHPMLRLKESHELMVSIVNGAMDDCIIGKDADKTRTFILQYAQPDHLNRLKALLIMAVQQQLYALLFDLLKIPFLMNSDSVRQEGIRIDYHNVKLYTACAFWSFPEFNTKGLNFSHEIEPNALLESSKEACAIRLQVLNGGRQGLMNRMQTEPDFSPYTWNDPSYNTWAVNDCLAFIQKNYLAQVTQYAEKLLSLRNALFFKFDAKSNNMNSASSVSRFKGSFDKLPEELIDKIVFKMIDNNQLKFAFDDIQTAYYKMLLK